MVTKTRNLYLICIIVVFAGCSKSRSIDNSEDTDGDAAPLSKDAKSEDTSGSTAPASEDTNFEDGGGGTAPVSEVISILGTWRGSEIGEGLDDTWTFEISRSEVAVTMSGIEAYIGRYHINADVVPHQVDFYIDSSSISSLVGKTCLGIFLYYSWTCRLSYPPTIKYPTLF
jgi:hypothetical protein